MAYTQVTPPQGNINNLPPAPYNGNHETIQGAMHLIDGMFVELYGIIPGGSAGGALISDAAPGSGSITGYAPGGFGSATTRLDIAADDAGTSINDLPVGYDGQRVRVRNIGANGTLTLVNANSGSTAAKRFSGQGNAGMPPGDSWDIIYYAGSVNRWTL